jgi:transitional endoplasmic reticulum ATPase
VRSFFLNEVDGLQANDGILMVGSTNHLDRLDPGIAKRPSRFDRKFFFPDPNLQQRVKYCEFWQGKLKKGGSEDVKFPDVLCLAIAKITDGFSFAYIQEAFVAALVEIAAGREAAVDGEMRKETVAIEEWELVGGEEDRSTSSDSPGGDDQRPDLDKYLLWRVIKKQVAILRKELNNRAVPT